MLTAPPVLPVSRTVSARPCPSVLATLTDVSVPLTYCANGAVETVRVQLWYGFVFVASPASLTPGNVPPAVHPPVDAENSALCTALPRMIAIPDVPVTAAVDRVSSREAPLRAAPRYTWQVAVSQVFA